MVWYRVARLARQFSESTAICILFIHLANQPVSYLLIFSIIYSIFDYLLHSQVLHPERDRGQERECFP